MTGRRDPARQLRIEGDANRETAPQSRLRQQAVITAFAAAQPPPAPVESHAGNQGEVDPRATDGEGAQRLADAVPPLAQTRAGLQPRPFIESRATRENRDAHPFAVPPGMADNPVQPRLGRQCEIDRHDARATVLGQRQDPPCDRGGGGAARLFRHGMPDGFGAPAQPPFAGFDRGGGLHCAPSAPDSAFFPSKAFQRARRLAMTSS